MHVVQCSFPSKLDIHIFIIRQCFDSIIVFVSRWLAFPHWPIILRSIMASVDAGDQGTIQVLSRHPNNKCIATITRNGDMPFTLDVVIESESASWKEGTFRILEKLFNKRQCIMEITESNANMQPFNVTWNLDEPTTALLQQ